MPGTAEYFKRERIEIVNEYNNISRMVRSYDLAGSEAKNADYTASCLIGMGKDDKIIVKEINRYRYSTDKVERLIMENALKDGKGVRIILPQEPAAAGKAWADKLSKMLHGYSFVFVPQTRTKGDAPGKVTRALPLSAQALKGNLVIVSGPHKNYAKEIEYNCVKECLDELEGFCDDDKMYANDDMVDCMAQGYNELSKHMLRFRHIDGINLKGYTFGGMNKSGKDDWNDKDWGK
jgi:predicted phage terminase large subunit-like protein